MNKSELINAIAKDAGISKAAARAALDSFTNNITKTLKTDEKFSLIGWGTWSSSNRSKRNFKNPNTGETVKIKEKKVIKFKAGTKFLSSLNS